MKVYDSVYGEFSIPQPIEQLMLTPEVRRLSQVRLLNSLSPSISALSEVRRYSHTLGVAHLALLNAEKRYSREERDALMAAVLLHDVGTPAFGHLLENHFRDGTDWSHESIIGALVHATHAPENRGHQIFGGWAVRFEHELRRSGVNFDLVEAIVTRRHILSALLFGTLDLDNIDNVVRMAWGLGIARDHTCALTLARELGVSPAGELTLRESGGRAATSEWAALRRQAYEILNFDPPTVAAQAVLSDAIARALQAGVLGVRDWPLTDEQLLETLRAEPTTKDAIMRQYLGVVPKMVFALQIRGTLKDLPIQERGQAKEVVEEVLRSQLGPHRVLGYVQVDRGVFEKQLRFVDPETGALWEQGRTSESVLVYGFAGGVRPRKAKAIVEEVVGRLGAPCERVLRVDIPSLSEPPNEQQELDLASAAH